MLEYKKVCFLSGGFMSLKIAVIGAGPAGYPAALTAARLGAQVTLIEKAQPGGVCLHSGCIPSKSLLDAAHRLDTAASLAPLCDTAPQPPTPSWPKIQARQLAVTRKLTAGISSLLRQAKVTLLAGTAEFVDGHSLRVHTAQGEEVVPFDKAIVATGSQAFVPPPLDQLPGLVYDNSTIFQLPALPQQLVIVGGGAIGCELATLFASLGVSVQLVEMQPRLLPGLDESLSRIVTKSLQKRGVTLLTGKQVTSAQASNGQAVLQLSDGSSLTAPAVLAAIGRSCDLSALQPQRAGLAWTRKGLQGVHRHTLQVSETIYAAGDVTGLTLLAHAATRQGQVAAQNACGQSAVYHQELIPNAVYTVPELACVGLSPDQARARGLDVKIHKAYMLANGRAQTMDQTDGLLEITSEAATGKLLGAVLACPHASEIISTFTVALQAGLTVQQLQQVVFPHPTLSEAIGDALAK